MLRLRAMLRESQSALSGHARLVACSSVALLVPLLYPVLTGRVFTRDDLGALHLPFRFLYHQALQAGEFLLWTPAYHSGFFLFAAGEAGMAHPLHFALYRFLALGPAFNLEMISSYVLLFAGTALLWRRLGISLEGALFGAMLFTFSGFNLFNFMHVNHIGTFAHAPWILLATHALLTEERPRGQALAFGGLALLTGMQLLAGNPQYAWLTNLAVAFLVGAMAVCGTGWRRIALTGVALVLGLLIGGVQLLPTLEFLRDSTRSAWTTDAALTFSLSPLNLVQLWAPFAFEFRVAAPPAEEFLVHEFIVYNGAFCTAALAWTALRYRHLEQKTLAGVLLAFAALNLVLAFGRHGGVYPLLAELPGLRSLRAPARHLVLIQLALSGVAGIVLEDLLALVKSGARIAWRQLWPLAVIIGLSITSTIVGSSLAGSSWASEHGLRFSGLARSAPWTLIVVTVVVLVAMVARGVRGALAAVIVVSAIDLGLWGYSYAYRWGPIQPIAELVAEATAPPDARPGDLIPTFVGGRDGYAILRDLRLTMGYTGLYSSRTLNPRDPLVQRVSGLTWDGDGERWFRVVGSMPRARLMAEARTSSDPALDLSAIDPSRVALVDRALPLNGTPGLARVTTDRPGHLIVDTVGDGQQLLVLTERYHRGWIATIDGDGTEPIRVYGDFLGSVVPAGSHRVVFQFRPRSVRVGLLATLTALAAALMASYWLSRSGSRFTSSSMR